METPIDLLEQLSQIIYLITISTTILLSCLLGWSILYDSIKNRTITIKRNNDMQIYRHYRILEFLVTFQLCYWTYKLTNTTLSFIAFPIVLKVLGIYSKQVNFRKSIFQTWEHGNDIS